MNSIWTIARKELSDSLRNRWLMAISLVFARGLAYRRLRPLYHALYGLSNYMVLALLKKLLFTAEAQRRGEMNGYCF